MASTDKDFIVAIELGSSRISGVAGKKNSDGSMQILAYAQVKSSSCIKRGVVYNIDKTTQCIGDVIKKLESVLKTKIVRAYVGISGQSLRSFRCSVKRNLLAQSYITSEIIDSLRDDCREIPYQDYEILDNFPQEYLVDANTVSDPVGVMGTNVEGVYLNIIARNTLRMNIHNCFANADVEIADELIAACKLGNHVLSEAEKRSGCALVDLGAETTTVVVYKNNIVRHLVVLPLGANNITKDIVSLQIDEEEAENIKLKYGDACPDLDAEFSDNNKDAEKIVISDGRSFDLFKIHNIIKSRVDEIIENVDNQIISSRYRDKLLAGIILTGGGANLKNIDKSFVEHTKIDKIRLAKASDMPSIKPGISGIELDNMRNNVLLSLLLEGSLPCGGDDINETPSIFDIQAKEEEKQKKIAAAKAEAEAESNAISLLNGKKAKMRATVDQINAKKIAVNANPKDKKIRKDAQEFCSVVLDVIDGDFTNSISVLAGKEKYKQAIKEATDISEKLKEAQESLLECIEAAKKSGSFLAKLKSTFNDIINE